MPDTARSRTGLQAFSGTADDLRDIDTINKTQMDTLEAIVAIDDQGPYGGRPSAGRRGRYYFATDRKVLYRDNSTGWDVVSPQRRVADVNATTYTFSGLDGSTDGAYRLTFEGYWGGAGDIGMHLRLAGATAATCLHRRCYFQSGAVHEDVLTHPSTTDVFIGGHYFGGLNMIVGEATIQAAPGPNSRVVRGSYTSRADFTGGTEPVMMGDIAGYWVGGGNMTSLTVDFGGQNFSGRLWLETLS